MQEKSNESEKKKAIIKNFKRIGVKDGMSLDFFQIELTKPIKPAKPGLKIIDPPPPGFE
jgi:hypothetical protein